MIRIQLLCVIISSLLVISGYYYWKHEVVHDALIKERGNQKEFIDHKQREVDFANEQTRKRANNAIQVYVKRYDDLRLAAANTPKRVFVKSSACVNPMPRTAEDRSSAEKGLAGIGQAELPETNLRSLDEVIDRIEALQLKSELVLNTME